MNNDVKFSIDNRKTAIENAYELTADAKKKVDSLFKEIEAFGASCKDSIDFETKFATSPLNQKYTALFTEIAQTCKSVLMSIPDPVLPPEQTAGDVVADLAKTEAELAVDGTIQHFRGRAYRAAHDKARDIPVVGDAIDLKNKIDFFSRFKK
ncbi:hypothetical protein IKX12_02420 [Candidatus Saccharibacteria bacterium]|nr:hypothetical protein [Candidatus Saccharibacteria bacterium]